MHTWQRFPLFAAVVGTENVAGALILHAPGGNKHGLGVVRIDGDVIEHIIIAASQFGKSRPVMASIFGDENHACAGAQENTVRVVRIIGQTAYIASVGTQNRPLASPRTRTYRS